MFLITKYVVLVGDKDSFEMAFNLQKGQNVLNSVLREDYDIEIEL